MGEVWWATDERLHGRACAIKTVLVGGTTAEERAERMAWFNREAEVLARLHYPAICDIRDRIVEAQAQYLILGLIEGETLAQVMAAHQGGVSEDVAVSWALQLCGALAYLHTQNPPVIFRDLKPDNVMLRADGSVVLIDFGIARTMAPTIGTAIGTGGYAPPEQYQGYADARSDVYSLGATLHHLLTGRDPTKQPPFSFPPLRALAPNVGTDVEAAVMRALDMDLAKRFPSAHEFATALEPAAAPPLIARRYVQQPSTVTATTNSTIPSVQQRPQPHVAPDAQPREEDEYDLRLQSSVHNAVLRSLLHQSGEPIHLSAIWGCREVVLAEHTLYAETPSGIARMLRTEIERVKARSRGWGHKHWDIAVIPWDRWIHTLIITTVEDESLAQQIAATIDSWVGGES